MFVELADLVSEQTNFGMAQRALVQFGNQQTDSVGNQGSAQPANGQGVPPGQTPEYLHGPAYAAAVDNLGKADCEALQRGYVKRLNAGDPQQRNLDWDAHTPGRPGTNLDRARAGSARRDVHPQPVHGTAAHLQPGQSVTHPGGELTLGGDLQVGRLGFGAMRITGRGRVGRARGSVRGPRAPAPRRRGGSQPDRHGRLLRAAGVGEPDRRGALSLSGGSGDRHQGRLRAPGPGRWEPACRPERLSRCCEDSLRRLRLERIDLYQLHTVDPKVPIEDSIGALVELQEEGKVRHIGVSNVSGEELERARSIAEIVSVQNRFNLTDRGSEEVLESCERTGSASCPGIRWPSGSWPSPAVRSRRWPGPTTPPRPRSRWPGCFSARRSRCRFPGTSSLAHFEENLEAGELELSEEEMQALTAD